MRIILASDLHISNDSTPENSPWVNHFCNFLTKKHDPETLIIFMGDIIDKGNATSCDAADRIFTHIEARLRGINHSIGFLPGNHDYCRESSDAFDFFCSKHQTLITDWHGFSRQKVYSYCRDDIRCNFVLADSIQDNKFDIPGKLDLNEISNHTAPNKTNILLLHHSIYNEDTSEHTGLVEQPRVIELLDKYNVDYVFHGHAHCTRVFNVGMHTKMFGVGSLGLSGDSLGTINNEFEQFFELTIKDGYLENVVNWLWRESGEYYPIQIYPNPNTEYAPNFSIEKVSYEKPDEYYDRYVMEYSLSGDDFLIALNADKKQRLSDVCTKDRRILLIADAGMGKSIEMSHLAWEIGETNPYLRPVLLGLNHYDEDSIQDYINKEYPQYKTLDPSQFILILDGYDELSNSILFKKHLLVYLDQHSDIHVCMSLRSNFLSKNIELFEGFKVYRLLGLSHEDIETFLDRFGIDSEAFVSECTSKRMASFLANPFYLKLFADYYRDKGTISNLPDVLNRVIEKTFEEDSKKFEYVESVTLEESKHDWKRALTRFAYGLQLLNRTICDDDTYQGILDTCDLQLLKHSGIIINNKGERMFSHNIIREYLLADWMREDTTESIMERAALPNRKGIYQNWHNIIGLLLQVNPSPLLIDMVNDAEPLLLAKLDSEYVTDDVKLSILKRFLAKTEDENIWFNNGDCDEIELGSFIQSEAALLLLLDHIEHPRHFRGLHFCVEVLHGFTNLYWRDDYVRDTLINCYQSKNTTPYVKSKVIETIAALHLDNNEITADLVCRFSDDADPYERRGVYRYLIVSNRVNNNYECLLDGLKHVSFRVHRSDTAYGIEEFPLLDGLNQIDETASVIGSILWFTQGDNIRTDVFNLDKFIDRIMSLAVGLFERVDDAVFAAVYKFLVSAIEKHENNRIHHAIVFFKKTDSFMAAMKKLFSEEACAQYYFYWEQEIEDRKSFVETICHLGAEGKLFDSSVLSSFAYRWNNTEGVFQIVDDTLFKLTGKRLEPYKQLFSYSKNRKEDAQVFFDALFDKAKMLSLVDELTVAYNDPELNCSRIREGRLDYESYPVGTRSLAFKLANERLKELKVKEVFNTINWELFVVDSVCGMLNADPENRPVVNESQREYLQKVYNDLLASIDFHTAYIETGMNWYKLNSAVLWSLVLKSALNFSTPENYYVGLIEIPYILMDKASGIEEKYNSIEEVIGASQIVNRILDLIHTETRVNLLYDFMYACERYSIKGCEMDALRLCGMDTPNYHKSYALKYLKKERGPQYIIDNIMHEADDELFMEIVRLLFKERLISLTAVMEKKFEETHNQELLAKLIWLGNKAAFKYYIDESRKKGCPIDYEDPMESITESIRSISDPGCLPFILDCIRLRYEKGFVDNKFYTLYNSMYSALLQCASDNSSIVVGSLKCLIAEDQSNIERVGFCNAVLNEIYQKEKTNPIIPSLRDVRLSLRSLEL